MPGLTPLAVGFPATAGVQFQPVAGASSERSERGVADIPGLTEKRVQNWRAERAIRVVAGPVPVRGRRRFRGRLCGVLEGILRLATVTGEERLPLAGVASAKLVLGALTPARPGRAKPAERSKRLRAGVRQR